MQKREGPSHPDPEIRWGVRGGRSQKLFFGPSGLSLDPPLKWLELPITNALAACMAVA